MGQSVPRLMCWTLYQHHDAHDLMMMPNKPGWIPTSNDRPHEPWMPTSNLCIGEYVVVGSSPSQSYERRAVTGRMKRQSTIKETSKVGKAIELNRNIQSTICRFIRNI